MTTQRSKTTRPRPSYKTMYLRALGAYTSEQARATLLAQKLRRIQQAIAPHGRRVIEGIPDGDERIALDSFDYVAVEAEMEMNARFSADDLVGFHGIALRGRPIVESH